MPVWVSPFSFQLKTHVPGSIRFFFSRLFIFFDERSNVIINSSLLPLHPYNHTRASNTLSMDTHLLISFVKHELCFVPTKNNKDFRQIYLTVFSSKSEAINFDRYLRFFPLSDPKNSIHELKQAATFLFSLCLVRWFLFFFVQLNK